jgi:hypothetical protein
MVQKADFGREKNIKTDRIKEVSTQKRNTHNTLQQQEKKNYIKYIITTRSCALIKGKGIALESE